MSVSVNSLTIMGSRRRGRPPRAEASSKPRNVLFSPNELERAKEAARVNRQTFSEFVRDATITAADDCLETK